MAEEVDDQLLEEAPTLEEGGDSGEAAGEDTDSPAIPPQDDLAVKVQKLESELEEANRRIAGQTRSWQQEEEARQQIEDKLLRIKNEYGILDEDVAGGVQAPTQPSDTNVLSDAVATRLGNLEVRALIADYVLKNPDKSFIFKDESLRLMVEAEAGKILQADMKEFGGVVTEPEKILEKGVKKTLAFYNKLKAEGVKAATQQKTELKETGVDTGGTSQTPKESTGSDEETYSREDYMKGRRTLQNRLRLIE
jgi:hypothetical protein